MDEETVFLHEWTTILVSSLQVSDSIYLAILSKDGEIVYRNVSMQAVLNTNGLNSLVNPSFVQILNLPRTDSLIFEGFITFGDFDSINYSLVGKIYYKEDKFLIVAQQDTVGLEAQNKLMHDLNREVNNLQHELIQESNKLKLTMKQLTVANQQLKELNATKDKFFSIIAHDLKNPFNSLIGISKLIVKNTHKFTAEKIIFLAQTLYDTSTQGFQLLENLLTWSLVQRKQITPVLRPFAVNEIMEAIQGLCLGMAEQKNIQLHFEEAEKMEILADFSMASTVLRNLVTNALKFTDEGGRVTVRVVKVDDDLQVTVEDTGVGIEGVHLSHIFDIESKLSTRGTQLEQGTGLGLILCKEFVEKQGGKIWVESEVGVGSRFIFTLPVWCKALALK